MVTKQKILIVDDDENIAEMISLYLTKECFDTMIVHDREEALTAFESYQPNLMLLDLMLPGIDGYQAVSYTHLHYALHLQLPAARFPRRKLSVLSAQGKGLSLIHIFITWLSCSSE